MTAIDSVLNSKSKTRGTPKQTTIDYWFSSQVARVGVGGLCEKGVC